MTRCAVSAVVAKVKTVKIRSGGRVTTQAILGDTTLVTNNAAHGPYKL